MKILKRAKKIIEGNPIFIGSSSNNGKPNVTIVNGARIISQDKILLCDVQMTTCKEYLTSNPQCCLVVYDQDREFGYKIFGSINYLTSGQEFELARKITNKHELKAKGAIVVTVENIFEVK